MEKRPSLSSNHQLSHGFYSEELPIDIKGSLQEQRCSRHEGNGMNNKFIYLCKNTNDNILKCMHCIPEGKVPINSLIPIEEISSANEKTVYVNFPFSDQALTLDVKKIVLNSQSDSINQKIQQYFKDTCSQIVDKFKKQQEKMQEKVKQIADIHGEIITLYGEMSEKKLLESIVKNEEQPIKERIAELKALCERVCNKNEENTKTMRAVLDKSKIIQESFCFDSANLIKDQILAQIETIDLFSIGDFVNKSNDSCDSRNVPSQITNIMKLVRNKSNDISEESCSKLEEQLKRISFAMSKIEVPAVGPLFFDFEKLNEKQSKIIGSLVRDIALLNSQLQDENAQRMESLAMETDTSKEIIELVSNQTNFCSEEYIEELNNALDKTKGVLSLFPVRKLNLRTEEQLALNQLQQPQLIKVCKLAHKINELTQKNGDKYLLSNSPQVAIQLNSSIIQKQIGNVISLEENIKSQVDQMLVDLPIFETLPEFQERELVKLANPLPIKFKKTNYSHSQTSLTLTKIHVQCSIDQSKVGQSVTDRLDNNRAYALKLSFNYPLKELTSGYFLIGLIPEQWIDQRIVCKGSGEAGFSTGLNNGAKEVIEGKKLSCEPQRSAITSLEFRWHIAEKKFFIADQSYENINKVEENHFDPTYNYRFGIAMINMPHENWQVTVTEFSEIDPAHVNNFKVIS